MKNNLIFTVLALSVVSTGLAMDKEKKDEGKKPALSAASTSERATAATADSGAASFSPTPNVLAMSDAQKRALLERVFEFSKGKFPG